MPLTIHVHIIFKVYNKWFFWTLRFSDIFSTLNLILLQEMTFKIQAKCFV